MTKLIKNEILNIINSNNINTCNILGLYTTTILSKEILKTNKDVVNFINSTLNIDLPIYITKSRTLICAKCSRLIFNYSIEEQKNIYDLYIENLYKLDVFKSNDKNDIFNVKQKKHYKNNEKLSKWLEKL